MARSVKLALFGQPVKHSQSPKIHQGFAAQFGLNIDYQLIETNAKDLHDKVKQFFAAGGQGANVTVPHKQNIIPLLNGLSDRAQQAGAVNTLFKKGDLLWGDNTDGDGLVMDLQNKGIELSESSVLTIGAGGAVQGIIPALLDSGVAQIDIQNRSAEKAAALAEKFNRCSAYTKNIQPYDLIIHATSMGHHGLSPALHQNWFAKHTIAYDLSYGSAAAPFLNAANAQGIKAAYDGLGMLYSQAALAFEIWFKNKPTSSVV